TASIPRHLHMIRHLPAPARPAQLVGYSLRRGPDRRFRCRDVHLLRGDPLVVWPALVRRRIGEAKMPPLWFIVGIAFVLVFWWLADRSVLRPGAARVMVDGREVLIRRKRDSQFVIAVMMALFTGVVVVGAVIVEEDGLLPVAVFFV